MKLAVAVALLRCKPREYNTGSYVQSVSLSWQNRNNKDSQYIRWLELERLQLLQKTALLSCEKEDESQPSSSVPVSGPVRQVNITGSRVEFLRSTFRFLQLTPASSVPNYREVLDVTTEDLVRNIRELMHGDGEMFVDTFSGLLEKCCSEYRHVMLNDVCVRNLVDMAELLGNFVAVMKTNKLCEHPEIEDSAINVDVAAQKQPNQLGSDECNPFAEARPKSENDEIKLLLAPRSEKQVIVSCIVELTRNPKLKDPVQQVLCVKIQDICSIINGDLISKRPDVLDSLYYFTEGLSKSGPVDEESMRIIKKCIDLTIVRFPVAARLLLVCCSGNQEGAAFDGS